MFRSTLMIVFLVGMLVAVGTMPVHAQSDTQLTCQGEELDLKIDRAIALLNNNTDEVPSSVAPLVGSNTTEIHIQNADQEYYTVHVDDSLAITEVSVGSPENPDVLVRMDRKTACTVYTADDPIAAGLKAYEEQEITMEATTPVNKAKVFIAERAMDAASLFN